jgi:arylsulfatase A-like enzyme
VGKYLNRYPFGRLPFVPPGWDRFLAKQNQTGATVYRDFHAVDQASPVFVRRYATDWLAERAVGFVRSAPASQPFFLLYAPSAPHAPWIPAARHEGALAPIATEEPPSVVGALRGAPPWVRSLPVPSAAQRTAWFDEQRRAAKTLRAVDEALHAIVSALGDRLDDTVIFVLSDNGYSFGEHRWEGKTCPYEACVRIPLAVHVPGLPPGDREDLVSIVDLAPTILDLAGVRAPAAVDGASFAGTLAGDGSGAPAEAVFLEWAGDERIPAWTAVRTPDYKLIRYADGFEELYDLSGRRWPADPWEMINRTTDPRAATILARLRALLGRVVGPG